MARVIIVEDDSDLRDTLLKWLNLYGIETTAVGSGMEFYQSLAAGSYDVAILDVGLPDGDGFAIAEFVRRNTAMGIIMLTARGRTEDRVQGFEAGADVYLVKPVDCREIVAAVSNLSKRITTATAAPGAAASNGKEQDIWVLDRTQWRLRAPDGSSIPLTAKEMRLVECLVTAAGDPVVRGDLMAALDYLDGDQANRNLDALVRRLRRKAEGSFGNGLPIKTIHSVGYLFSAPVSVI